MITSTQLSFVCELGRWPNKILKVEKKKNYIVNEEALGWASNK